MSEELDLLKRRFAELAKRSEQGYFTFTDFLGLAEQSAFNEIKGGIKGISYSAFGGAEGTERVMIRFGSPEELGYEEEFPIVTLMIKPKSEKFADRLTHRDFLGALMSLGIERSVLGDIVIRNNIGYLFAKEDIGAYIIDSLTEIKHTAVTVSVATELPEGELFGTEIRRIQLSSERLDAVLAKTFSLSREDASRLFGKGLVFVNGRETSSASYTPKVGDRITARGYGRLIYRGVDSTSKKGKLNTLVEVYI